MIPASRLSLRFRLSTDRVGAVLLTVLVLGSTLSPARVAAIGEPPVIAADSFTRTATGAWGTADTGGPWTLDGGSGVFSVNGSVGSVNLPKATASRAAFLNGPAARDVDIRFRVSGTRPAGGPLFVYAVSRRGGNDEFRSKLIFNANGSMAVHASRFVDGAEASLAPQVVVPGLTQSPGTFLNLRTQVTGASPTTIRVKAWADAAAEPAAWQFTTTSGASQLQDGGTTGLRMYLNTGVTNAPAALSFDDLSVESLDTVAPVAAFTWAGGIDWQTVDFTDTSVNTPTSWTWDFGDGGISTQENPSHTYAAEATYTVTLTATNSAGSSSSSQSVDVVDTPPPPPPTADFSWALGVDWKTVDFTDASTGSPTSWTWDFGDGGSSNLQSPSHAYAAEGSYTVTLTATNAGGSKSNSHDVELVEPPPPPPTVLAADAFSRTYAGSWRVADTGGLYSYSGPMGDFAVNGGAATMRLPSAGASRSAFLYSTLASDVDLTMVVSANKVATGGSFYAYAALRRQADGASYRPKIRIAPDGSVFAHAGRFLPSGETSLGAEVRVTGLTFTAGARIHIRVQATGTTPTTIRVRVWADGQPEPTAWHFTANDSAAALQKAGALGMLAHVTSGSSTAPLIVSFDDLLATTANPVARVTGETFVGAGDIALCNSSMDEATATLLDQIDGTVFTAGDNAQAQATTDEFNNCYDPTWGRHKPRTHPAIGNHEYNAASNAAPYYEYFGAAAGELGKGWYAYDVGSWRVRVLNANCGIVACTVGSPQEQWLRSDLVANPRTCSIAIWHQPRWSSGSAHGSTASTQPFWQALYDYGAEIVISGHDHDYERFAPMNASGAADPTNGIREFVVGTGGAGLRTLAPNTLPTTEIRQATSQGVLKLTLGQSAYEWEFIPIAGQAFTDRGSGTCH